MTPPEIPAGSVVITATQMYQTMIETRDEVRRLSTIMDPAITELRASSKELDHRVALLEKWRWLVIGAAAGGGLLAGQIGSFLGGN